jgi:hypothetical protein
MPEKEECTNSLRIRKAKINDFVDKRGQTGVRK